MRERLRKTRQLEQKGLLGLAVKGELGRWISSFGELVHSKSLIFNPYTYLAFHRGALETAPLMVDALLRVAPEIKSIVDLGCGTGVYLSEFRNRGIRGVGYEHSDTARRLAAKFFGLDVKPFDVASFSQAPGRPDACLCIEIAHYMPEGLGLKLVDICARSAPLIVFSSAHPRQGGQGHVNEQPRTYWIEQFVRRGCTFDADRTSAVASELEQRVGRGKWLAENICLLTAPAAECS